MSEKNSTQGYCFTATFNSISRVLHNEVELESAINPCVKLKIKALWDTGATNSVIRPELAAKLELQPVGKVLINTPSGKDVPSNVYFVNLYLPNHVAIPKIPVLEGIPNNCDMLIGMDVIKLGDFAVSNYNGKTTFSFRMPSMAMIDFVKHSYLIPI